MPIYEYECSDCKEHFEELVLSQDASRKIRCPKCASRRVKRLFSAFGISGTDKPVSSCGTCSAKTCKSCRT
ncbi:MAG: zinc ribbon domain-containing protein [candidate division WOR-3 bacterium]